MSKLARPVFKAQRDDVVLGVALLTSRTAHRVPERVRLKKLSAAPEPVCIAVGHRDHRTDDKPLSVFVVELRKAAVAFA